MLYPTIKIEWKYVTWWTLRCFIFGCVCDIIGHRIENPLKQSYPGYVFCQRCRRHIEWREAKRLSQSDCGH